MFTPGNTKLGKRKRIWGFGLPSRRTCPRRSELCARLCYSHHLESFRPSVRRRYRRNLALSRSAAFTDRVVTFLRARRVEVVRLHTAGDFYSPGYARKWLAVMRRMPSVRFYFYSRSWRRSAIRRVFAVMAGLANVRVWFSCDRETGVPRRVPRGVRLAWLMTAADDRPPRADLVFRVRRLRHVVQKRLPWTSGDGAALVCPTENGATGRRTDCVRCGVCWGPPGGPAAGSPRLSLPIVDRQ
jgi:hypothetical protein